MKNYRSEKEKNVVIYKGDSFEIFKLIEFLDLYAGCSPKVRLLLAPVLAKL